MASRKTHLEEGCPPSSCLPACWHCSWQPQLLWLLLGGLVNKQAAANRRCRNGHLLFCPQPPLRRIGGGKEKQGIQQGAVAVSPSRSLGPQMLPEAGDPCGSSVTFHRLAPLSCSLISHQLNISHLRLLSLASSAVAHASLFLIQLKQLSL